MSREMALTSPRLTRVERVLSHSVGPSMHEAL